jgi:hypothetical protein
MLRYVKFAGVCVAVCACVCLLCGHSHAGTIIKLSLSEAPADVVFSGANLSTIDDGDAATTGDQNTSAIFLDFLDPLEADILAPTASFSLGGLTASGFPLLVPPVSPVLVIQDFIGGTFELYDSANTLLLSGVLDDSTLTGPIGPPATGALFTTSFGLVNGGTLSPFVDADTLTLSMSFTEINGGAGFGIGATAPVLLPFTADASVNIAAEPIPEPAAIVTLLVASSVAVAGVNRRRR